jgi:hypothetical protein
LNSFKIYKLKPLFGEKPIHPQKVTRAQQAGLKLCAGKSQGFLIMYLWVLVLLESISDHKKPDNFDNLYIPGLIKPMMVILE